MTWMSHTWSVVTSALITPLSTSTHFPVWLRRRGRQVNLACAWAATICCLLAIDAHAGRSTFRSDPDYLIDTWETEDGLPENSATAIVQTPDGYLWFGTFNGLVRFDGIKFTVLNRGNTAQLPDAGIVNLHLDHRGWLWVSTLRGLVVREAREWRRIGANEGWVGDYARTFTERANGDLLITTFDGHVLEFVDDRLSELPAPPGESGKGYFGAVDEAGRWWATQSRFVGYWDGQRWFQAPLQTQLQRDAAVPCLSAREGGVWVLFGNQVLKFRQGTEVSRVPVPEMSGGIWGLSEDSRTNVWICSYDSGLFRLDPSGALQHWTTTNGLANLGCRVVFEDRERNLWVGTSGGGLTRFKPRRFQEMGRASLLSRSVVKSVSPASGGGMWIATFDKGLFRHDALGVARIAVPAPGPGLNQVYGLSVLEDRAGRVWYGETDGCWWRRGSGSFERVPLPWAPGDSVSALWEDSTGRVWISSRRGVAVCDGNQFREFGAEAGLPPGAVAGFREDRAGVPWLAAGAGVFRYEQDRFVEVRTLDAKSLRAILSFKADPDGTMWMGSRDDGLWRWRNGRISRIGAAAGLPDQAVRAIIEDAQGYFWMPTSRGIVRAARQDLNAVADGAKAQLNCQLLDQHDGLPSVEFSAGQPSCVRDGSGRLWFATQKGVAMIDPASFRLNALPPPVHIEQLDYLPSKAGNRQRAGESGSALVRLVAPFPEPLRLPPGSHGQEIVYTTPTFSAPEKARFQTRLDESNRDWEDANGERSVRFYQLPPGDHVFRVRAANDDGVLNETGASLAFTILPFFWQTAWFRVVEALLILGCGGGGMWWLVRARLRRALEREQMAMKLRESEERLTLAADAAHLGIWIRDLVHDKIWASDNWRRLLGFAKSERIDLDAFLLKLHPEDRKAMSRTLAVVVAGGGQYETEYRVVLPNDHVRWIGSRGRIEFNGEGKPALVRGVSVDITERKQAEHAMEQQRNELAHLSRVTTLSELSGSLAHELNQPLAIILTNAQAAQRLLAQSPPDLAEASDILADIVSEDQRAGDVIRRLRSLLKPGDTNLQPISANEILEDVLRIARSDLIGRGVSVHRALSGSLPPILGDRVQLQQVLLNLILNACDAMNGNPPARQGLSLNTLRRGEVVRISVTDSGCGLPPNVERVFEPFYTTKKHGLGLGLSICRSIVTAHKGRLWAEANADSGATFHLELPAGAEGK